EKAASAFCFSVCHSPGESFCFSVCDSRKGICFAHSCRARKRSAFPGAHPDPRQKENIQQVSPLRMTGNCHAPVEMTAPALDPEKSRFIPDLPWFFPAQKWPFLSYLRVPQVPLLEPGK